MRIAKEDGRIAEQGLVYIDDGQLAGAPLRRFILAGRGGTVDVLVVGDELDLQPERSASHKALCAALGMNL
jgi:hypothetical protein